RSLVTSLDINHGSPDIVGPVCGFVLDPLSCSENGFFLPVGFELALPYHCDPPALLEQEGIVTLVACNSFPEFFLPEVESMFWSSGIPAVLVPMPEATVDEAYCSESCQDHVRLSGQLPGRQAVA